MKMRTKVYTKTNTKINTRKKGVSPLVAAVLLIAFTMAIAAVLTAWISTFTAQQRAQTAVFEEKIRCAYAAIAIDKDRVIYDSDWAPDGISTNTSVISMRIKNTGASDIRITGYETSYEGRLTPVEWTIPDGISISRSPENNSFEGAFNLSDRGQALTAETELTKITFLTVCDAVWDYMEQPLAGWPAANLEDKYAEIGIVAAVPE